MASFLEGAISTYRVQGERLAWEMALKGGFGRQRNPTLEGRGISRRSCLRSQVEMTKKVKAFIASIAAGSSATVCLDGIRNIGEVEKWRTAS